MAMFCYNQHMSFWQKIEKFLRECFGFRRQPKQAREGGAPADSARQDNQDKNTGERSGIHTSEIANGADSDNTPIPPKPESNQKEGARSEAGGDDNTPAAEAEGGNGGLQNEHHNGRGFSGNLNDDTGDSVKPATDENNGIEERGGDNAKGQPENNGKDTRKQENAGKTEKTPIQRGGARGRDQDTGTKPPKKRFKRKPEFICRKKGGKWEMGIKVPEQCHIIDAKQDGMPLSPDGDEYRLANFKGRLSIKYRRDSEEPAEFPDAECQPPFIFKTRAKWKGVGRKVRGISGRCYVVFAPKEWERKDNPPVASQQCADNNFLAHFFFVRKGAGGYGFVQHDLPGADGFKLKGETVFDDSDKGDLFVRSPPELETKAAHARAGSEGAGGWRGQNFIPGSGMLGSALGGREGWLYIRVYDDDVNLMDSGDFRYFSGLRQILVNGVVHAPGALMAPSAKGHDKSVIRFVGSGDKNIAARPKNGNQGAVAGDDGAVTIERVPEADMTHWVLEDGTKSVDVTIVLPRVWWRIAPSENGAGAKWRDTPEQMNRAAFREYAEKGMAVEIRLPFGIKGVRVGFDGKFEKQILAVTANDGCIIPLIDFMDYAAIEEESRPLSLDVQCKDSVFSVVRIAGGEAPGKEKPPKEAKPEADSSVRKDDAPRLSVCASPRVKSRHSRSGWRCGKGFSPEELAAVDVAYSRARRMGVKIDARRRTAHPDNITALTTPKDNHA